MDGTAIPVATIVMGGVLLSVIAWKVLDIAKHAVATDRQERVATRDDADDEEDAR